jgi:hypothetical protein
MKDEALKLALEALEFWDMRGVNQPTEEAITSIKQALAAPTVQEPDGEVGKIVMFGGQMKEVSWKNGKMPPVGSVLYTTPPTAQRQSARSAWVGLTDEEIAMAWPYELGQLEKQFAFNLEVKLKEKNSD